MSSSLHAYFGLYIKANIDRNATGLDDVWSEVRPNIWIPNNLDLVKGLDGHYLDIDTDGGYVHNVDTAHTPEFDYKALSRWFIYFEQLDPLAVLYKGIVVWYM